MGEKRVIEQVASNEVHNDDWFLKDSPTQDTSKISATNLKAILGADGTLALEEIANAIAEEYNPSATYNKGAYVFYEGTFYKCKQDGTTGTWDDSKWEEVNILEYIDYVLENAGKVDDVKVDGTSVVTNKVAEITLPDVPVQDVQVKTDSTYDSVVDASGNAKIDLSSVTAYGEVPNLPQAIATFKDGADAPMKSLKVAIEPQQDLHGYDAPWVGGAGKNKFADGTISFTRSKSYPCELGAGTYTLSALVTSTDTDATTCLFVVRDSDNQSLANGRLYRDTRSYAIFTITEQADNIIFYSADSNTHSQGDTATWTNVQVESGSTATTFAPYSNICPIIGWSEANVTVADATTDPTVENIYTIDLDGTRYGGEVDVVNGTMTVDRIGIVYDGSSDEVWTISPSDATAKIIGTATGLVYTYSPILSNCFATYDSQAWNYDNTIWGRYGQVHVNPDSSIIPSGLTTEGLAEWRTWLSTHNLQICYSLATPLTIQLTPTQVKSLLGSNNVWADTGDIKECVYRRDMTSTIDDIIARLEALEG